ncbi:MAG TPA: hypothetical protein VLM18_08905 [Croceibacterium sp.]|nr:hypothetical protein [Croceibacterium sp.]
MLRRIAAAGSALALATSAAAFEPALRAGETLEARVDGDLDGDGTPDVAWLAGNDERRQLVVHLSNGGYESLDLDTSPLDPGTLAITKGVLVFEDLTGGTTAIASTLRYRFNPKALRMRLIGLDATLYSRSQMHDGFEVSWNLLTGAVVTRNLHLNRKGKGDEAFDHIVEQRTNEASPPVWLSDTPEPEDVLTQFRGA